MAGSAAVSPPRERTVLLPATLCLTALTVVTAVAQRRVFADWAYLRPMLVVSVGLHALALALRALGVRLWLALPVLVAAAVELLALSLYADTLNGPLPSGATWELFTVDVRLVLDQFATAVAPVPSEGSFAVLSTIAMAVAVLMSDTFAFRAGGRVEAIIPTGVLFIFTAALGTGGGRVGIAAAWLAAAVLAVAVLRFHHLDALAWMGSRRLQLATTLPAIAIVVGVTAAAAAAVAPRLPGAGEKALVDTRNRRSSVTQVLSPLVDIRASLVNRGNIELFTVSSSDGGHYWRLIGLPSFDGSAWNPPEESLVRMGDRSGDVGVASAPSNQLFTITGMGGSLVPAAFYPARVSPDSVYWAANTNSLVLPDNNALSAGDQIAVQSLIPRPTVAQLQAAGVAGANPADLALPSGVPDVAFSTALQVTANAATPFDKALALQNFFRTSFTYDIDVQYGNSNDAIEAFLRDRRGFCQQFAGTFAVMARSLGIPARVAVGFTPGELGADGLYRVYGRHAHAWPEIWLSGIGWIPMEPTPGRGNADTAGYTGVGAAQEGTPADPGGGTGGENTPQ
ncbi:MAG TPA: hypothetical protein DCR14_06315, partial [Acidimicrobiaceae bacterium]|nr:hypothetical protein [Acidimicrobiaceae bacterium]